MQNQESPTENTVIFLSGLSANLEGQIGDRNPRHVRNPHPAARIMLDLEDFNADVNLERLKIPDNFSRLGTLPEIH